MGYRALGRGGRGGQDAEREPQGAGGGARAFDRRLGGAFLASVPRSPGVYLVSDAAGVVIYVGKAVNLRRRLSQYRNATRRKKHRKMREIVKGAASIAFEACATELGAELREAALIRGLAPRWNVAGAFSFLPRSASVLRGQPRPPGVQPPSGFPQGVFINCLVAGALVARASGRIVASKPEAARAYREVIGGAWAAHVDAAAAIREGSTGTSCSTSCPSARSAPPALRSYSEPARSSTRNRRFWTRSRRSRHRPTHGSVTRRRSRGSASSPAWPPRGVRARASAHDVRGKGGRATLYEVRRRIAAANHTRPVPRRSPVAGSGAAICPRMAPAGNSLVWTFT